MSKEDAYYLLVEFPKYKGLTLRGRVVQEYYEAERILKGLNQIMPRGCSCEYRHMAETVNKLHDKWLEENT